MTYITSISMKNVKEAEELKQEINFLSRNIKHDWNLSILTMALWFYFKKKQNEKKFIEELKEEYEKNTN